MKMDKSIGMKSDWLWFENISDLLWNLDKRMEVSVTTGATGRKTIYFNQFLIL